MMKFSIVPKVDNLTHKFEYSLNMVRIRILLEDSDCSSFQTRNTCLKSFVAYRCVAYTARVHELVMTSYKLNDCMLCKMRCKN